MSNKQSRREANNSSIPSKAEGNTVLTLEQVQEFLKANGLTVSQIANPAPQAVDTTIDLPVESRRPDLSKLPPPGERSCVPIQLPARVWGQPRYLK